MDPQKLTDEELAQRLDDLKREIAALDVRPEYLVAVSEARAAQEVYEEAEAAAAARARELHDASGVYVRGSDIDCGRPEITTAFREVVQADLGLTRADLFTLRWAGRRSKYDESPAITIARAVSRRYLRADERYVALQARRDETWAKFVVCNALVSDLERARFKPQSAINACERERALRNQRKPPEPALVAKVAAEERAEKAKRKYAIARIEAIIDHDAPLKGWPPCS